MNCNQRDYQQYVRAVDKYSISEKHLLVKNVKMIN